MTLRDHFEKETREELPLLKNYEYDHEGYYSDTASYFTEYSKWLETKLQNTSSNSDYAAAVKNLINSEVDCVQTKNGAYVNLDGVIDCLNRALHDFA